MPHPASPSNTKTIIIIDSDPSKDVTTSAILQGYQHNPQEAWLPITESRNGNTFFAAFHLLCSGIGLQALLLPVAFATLGWAWGIICLSLAFAWQLYTISILVRLHESVLGIRYSRYMHLAIVSFGPKLGKLLALFPVLYNSGGTCIILIITGGRMLDLIFKTLCDRDAICHAKSLTNTEWFLVFTCLAILIAQLPNLNSVAWVSLIGAITVVLYSTLIWALSITKDRPIGISYGQSDKLKSNMEKFSDVLNALGIIALAFKGHNVILEIQGTLPSSPKQTSYKSMCTGVTISYIVIAMCQYPLAIAGFWAYGNKVPYSGGQGLLTAFSQIHGPNTSKLIMTAIYLLVLVNCLCTFQVYAMVVFDNLESRVAMTEMVEPNYRKVMPLLPASPSNTKTLGALMQMIIIIDSDPSKDVTTSASLQGYQHNPQEAWLPITESRNGNTCFAAFHLLCSGIGLPSLLLPVAFVTLGW
nr:lysine histidine transporter-like 8 [Quercus suber]